jgi:superoxide reductase
MADLYGIYKCDICGNIVEVVHNGAGELVCCGKPMRKMIENTSDGAKEKHVPVIEKTTIGTTQVYKVSVGSIAHPMEEKHYIEWIELQIGANRYRKFLKPGVPPMAEFIVSTGISGTVTARE